MANRRVLKKQARKLLRRPAVDTLGEWLDANPRGLAVLDETGALARLLGRSRPARAAARRPRCRPLDARRGEDEYSEVPLAIVVQNSELELAQRRSPCERLTQHGASFEESSDHHRYTPLDWAVSRGEREMMEFILARGVSEQTRVARLASCSFHGAVRS